MRDKELGMIMDERKGTKDDWMRDKLEMFG
jgi:hypothetical protein